MNQDARDKVTSEAAAREFDLQRLPREADRAFIEAIDYRADYLGIVQVSGLNSSKSIWLRPRSSSGSCSG